MHGDRIDRGLELAADILRRHADEQRANGSEYFHTALAVLCVVLARRERERAPIHAADALHDVASAPNNRPYKLEYPEDARAAARRNGRWS